MRVENFSLKHTVESGQFFQFVKHDEGYIIWSADDVFYVEQQGDELVFDGVSEERLKEILALDIDYEEILSSISKDEHIKACIQAYPGLRVMKQDFFDGAPR